MKYRITLEVDIDLDALRQHDGKATPPPNDLDKWQASDVFAAHKLGILTPGETWGVEVEPIPVPSPSSFERHRDRDGWRRD